MTTRKQLRRKLFTAAVSSAMALTAANSNAFTFESSVKPTSSSAIQQVQYQPAQAGQAGGQPSGQPNTSVEAELKKMFEANGQPMPSMNEKDLPNAHVHQPAMGQQTKTSPQQLASSQQQSMPKPQDMAQPGMQQKGMATAQQPGRGQSPQLPKKNFLQKFIGKVSGSEKKAAEAAIVPPVPPGYQEPAPAPPSGGSVTAQMPNGQSNGQFAVQKKPAMQLPQNRQPKGRPAGSQQAQNSNAQNNTVRPVSNGKVLPNGATVQNGGVQQGGPRPANTQPRMAGNASQPGVNAGNQPQNRMTQASSPKDATILQGPSQAMKQPSQPVPAAPVFNVPAVLGAAQNRVANAASEYPTRRTQEYVQPGTAPAFMTGGQPPRNASPQSVQVAPVAAVPVPRVAPTLAKPMDDGFEDPFNDTSSADDTSDVLDLDAIANAPASDGAASVQTVVPEAVVATPKANVAPGKTAASPVTTFTESDVKAASVSPFTEDGGQQLDPVEEEVNPFTGVRLNDSDNEMFDPSLSDSPTASQATPKVRPFAPSEPSESFGEPAPPMDDFGSDLPAIELPPVDDGASQLAEPAPSVMAIPNLDGKEALSPNDSAAASTPVSSSTTNSSANPTGTQAVDVTESSTTPLRSVDSERLQQSAEQDRRSRQQRQIQSRTTQTGFKGFCPVELRDRRELIDVNSEFTATFGLQTYSFSSAAAKAAFEFDPSRYAPAAGGSDVVLLVNSGEEQPGMLDYALWYRDRLYLFRSRETMALFNSDPLRFSNQY